MTKYLFLYRGQFPKEPPSPEHLQLMLGRWQSWRQKFKDQVVDMGDGLKGEGKLLRDGRVSDGPLPEAKEIIGGYSIIRAESVEQALEVARECPIALMPGAEIEIRELMGF